MKTLQFALVFAVTLSLGLSFTPNVFAQTCIPVTITSLVGDKDALGTGTLPGNNLPGTSFDNRSPAELAATDGSENTDINVGTGGFGIALDFVDFFHNFAIPAGLTITSVDLEFGLGGMESNDNNPATKGGAEDGLFVDGVLIPDAFEMVIQGPSTYTIEPVVLSPADFTQFLDGSATLRIDSNSFGGTQPGQGSSPIFYDYTEITIMGCLDEEPPKEPPVGGEFLPIDSTALVLAGLQTSAIWMLPVLAGVAGSAFGVLYIKSRRN